MDIVGYDERKTMKYAIQTIVVIIFICTMYHLQTIKIEMDMLDKESLRYMVLQNRVFFSYIGIFYIYDSK